MAHTLDRYGGRNQSDATAILFPRTIRGPGNHRERLRSIPQNEPDTPRRQQLILDR
jgi:hypothetical protein